MTRFGRKIVPRRKPSAGTQARLAQAALRAARTAAESGKCGVAELLFGLGNVDLQGAVTRARGKGAFFRSLNAGMAGADAATAIIECRERELAARVPPGAGT